MQLFCSYTPVELKYLPLNTVIYGPIQENRTTDEVSEDGASDSNGSSSSGDDSSYVSFHTEPLYRSICSNNMFT